MIGEEHVTDAYHQVTNAARRPSLDDILVSGVLKMYEDVR